MVIGHSELRSNLEVYLKHAVIALKLVVLPGTMSLRKKYAPTEFVVYPG